MMKLFIYIPILIYLASEITASANEAKQSKERTSIKISFDETIEKKDRNKIPELEELLQNKAISHGLASGTEAINRSIESLMESLFYRVLDHDFRKELTDHSWFSLETERKVYNTATNSYVVIDRIGLGPRYNKNFWNITKVPINIGLDTTVDMLEIYPRKDSVRTAEKRSLPALRYLTNSWFGLLNMLTHILPPSFNPNELYDPLRVLETPFNFPISRKSFARMRPGTIRSFGIRGGVRIPFEISEYLNPNMLKTLSQKLSANVSLPFSLFMQGEHKISVLKRKENIAWVGLTTGSESGFRLSTTLGNTFYLFGNIISSLPWTGTPAPIFPINIEFVRSLVKKQDQLYEYDLNNKKALFAFSEAVKGDFSVSMDYHNQQHKQHIKTGVKYLFTQKHTSNDFTIKNSHSIFVMRDSRTQKRSKGIVKIISPTGLYPVLETYQDIKDRKWGILVGGEQYRTRMTTEINVIEKKIKNKNYYFYADKKNPYYVTINLNISDQYTDTLEYKKYINSLKVLTSLKLEQAPTFPNFDTTEKRLYSQKQYFDDPTKQQLNLHITPMVLGKFSANARVVFPSKEIDTLSHLHKNEIWRAFCQSYEMSCSNFDTEEKRLSWGYKGRWLAYYIAYPLRLMNIRIDNLDFIEEVNNTIDSLQQIAKALSPQEKINGFHKLFSTDNPVKLAKALLLALKNEDIPKEISFYTTSHSNLEAGYKSKFNKLNRLTVHGGRIFPTINTYQITKDKLQAFFPTTLKDPRKRPHIKTITIALKQAPAPDLSKNIFISITAQKLPPGKPAQVFIKLKDAGKLQLGKLVLAEEVFKLPSVESKSATNANKLNSQTFEFFLNGPTSPIAELKEKDALEDGGTYQLNIAISPEGEIWSHEQEITFSYKNKQLAPPE